MKHITFYFDFISPFAALAFEQLPLTLMGQSYGVTYKPILFAALLKHHGQLGPAEIMPKRDWTYRHVQWLAHSLGQEFQLPAAHPFNPISLLRLAVATNAQGTPNRYVTETIFHHIWRGGADATDAGRLATLVAKLAPPREINADDVKAQLKSNTDEALALGLFGVPTFLVDEKAFWGLDALPMLRDYLIGDDWFSGPAWHLAGQVPQGSIRPK
ncbi:MAG TPA: 2-hydroxychromene-2-carboxylate isomerase [Burkholderiaceae bacterium]|nr:2-hydroxychromene-2-carboxylate isomerase [Burkholderiaceae bacterium]